MSAGPRLRALEAGDSDDEDEYKSPFLTSKQTTLEKFRDVRYRYKTYLSFTWREIRKRKCSYFLGTWSCFLVVATVALLVSTLNSVPAVFLRLAELEKSDRDLSLTPIQDIGGFTMDYALMTKLFETYDPPGDDWTTEDFSFHAPRMIFGEAQVFSGKRCVEASEAGLLDQAADGNFNATWTYAGIRSPLDCQTDQDRAMGRRFRPGQTPADVGAPDACLATMCGGPAHAAVLTALDTAAEERMGFGKDWEYDPLPKGEAVIPSELAQRLQVEKGDVIIVSVQTSYTLLEWWKWMDSLVPDARQSNYFQVHMPFKVHAVADSAGGKFPPKDENWIVTEYSHFIPTVAHDVHPSYNPIARTEMAKFSPDICVSQVSFNFPPKKRFGYYATSNYDKIQTNVLEFGSQIMYRVGFTRFEGKVDILEFMRDARLFSMFLGLVISIIITILTVLSMLLIYSLLMINVETRTFELGVMRMLGTNRANIVQLILTQAFIYAIPAWIVGILFAQGCMVGVNYAIEASLKVEIPVILAGNAIFLATLLGTVIPLLSSLLPILKALGQNLQDSLDTRHSKTKAVEFTIERNSDGRPPLAPIIIGAFLALFGFLIYYLFPLALLTFNILLLFYMFFGLLLGMLFGLVLLSLNLEPLVERLLTFILFFWENGAIRVLIIKNLVAHRPRNRKTSIMYSLSLGFIIWISVSFNLQVISLRYRTTREYGTSYYIDAPDIPFALAKKLEQVALSSPHIKDWSWITRKGNEVKGVSETRISTIGRYRVYNVGMYGVSPNFLDVTGSQFLSIAEEFPTSATLTEQLYTYRGSYSMMLGVTFQDQFALEDLEDDFVVSLKQGSSNGTETFSFNKYEVFSPIAFVNKCPVLVFSRFPTFIAQDVAVSIPTFMRLMNLSSVEDLHFSRMLLDIPKTLTKAEKNALKFQIQTAAGGNDQVKLEDLEQTLEPVETASRIINLFFLGTTAIAMLICFFSLTSSMFTNIHEQTKEIGILRALGMKRFPIVRLYIEEALILVLSAALMGCAIGSAVSWTMALQRTLFTQLPLPFQFPTMLFLFVLGLGVLCAFFAPLVPTIMLLGEPIVYILRRLLT
eukprot:TRINITY_DN84526_c0_g1_i1.p1 TRINITY_DN84526_c0_g1~~TRINITY_DN84526_c0_g1_i1.p1  ORF type:complete len:1091 (+),score=42.23 TRINITY_DN84526_c0_g1_i1:9-3281(+)